MGDEETYRLVEEELIGLDNECLGRILVLCDREGDSFLRRMESDKKSRHDWALINIAASRLIGISKQIAIKVKLIKPLSDSDGIYAFELRPGPRKSVIRVMTYIPGNDTTRAVLLFPFEGHKGKKKGIPKKYKDKAKELAGIAERLLKGNRCIL